MDRVTHLQVECDGDENQVKDHADHREKQQRLPTSLLDQWHLRQKHRFFRPRVERTPNLVPRQIALEAVDAARYVQQQLSWQRSRRSFRSPPSESALCSLWRSQRFQRSRRRSATATPRVNSLDPVKIQHMSQGHRKLCWHVAPSWLSNVTHCIDSGELLHDLQHAHDEDRLPQVPRLKELAQSHRFLQLVVCWVTIKLIT